MTVHPSGTVLNAAAKFRRRSSDKTRLTDIDPHEALVKRMETVQEQLDSCAKTLEKYHMTLEWAQVQMVKQSMKKDLGDGSDEGNFPRRIPGLEILRGRLSKLEDKLHEHHEEAEMNVARCTREARERLQAEADLLRGQMKKQSDKNDEFAVRVEQEHQFLQTRLTRLIEERVEDAKQAHLQVWQQVARSSRLLDERVLEAERGLETLRSTIDMHSIEKVDEIKESLEIQMQDLAGLVRAQGEEAVRHGEELEVAQFDISQLSDRLSVASSSLEAHGLLDHTSSVVQRIEAAEELGTKLFATLQPLVARLQGDRQAIEGKLEEASGAQQALSGRLSEVSAATLARFDALESAQARRDADLDEALQGCRLAEAQGQRVDAIEQALLARLPKLLPSAATTRCLACNRGPGTGEIRARGTSRESGPEGQKVRGPAGWAPSIGLGANAPGAATACETAPLTGLVAAAAMATGASDKSGSIAKKASTGLWHKPAPVAQAEDQSLSSGGAASGSTATTTSPHSTRHGCDVAQLVSLPPPGRDEATPKVPKRPLTARPRR
mmetsp:Transcript_81743/g.212641  ORF Transcript_81743/g.212641 Transcript_81743/m.212641 type:complete len:553 (+) Transcript_81743:60-1718(+)